MYTEPINRCDAIETSFDFLQRDLENVKHEKCEAGGNESA